MYLTFTIQMKPFSSKSLLIKFEVKQLLNSKKTSTILFLVAMQIRNHWQVKIIQFCCSWPFSVCGWSDQTCPTESGAGWTSQHWLSCSWWVCPGVHQGLPPLFCSVWTFSSVAPSPSTSFPTSVMGLQQSPSLHWCHWKHEIHRSSRDCLNFAQCYVRFRFCLLTKKIYWVKCNANHKSKKNL